jgi:hypothetical protein
LFPSQDCMASPAYADVLMLHDNTPRRRSA